MSKVYHKWRYSPAQKSDLQKFTPKYWMVYRYTFSIVEEFRDITVKSMNREHCIETLVQNNNCSVKCYPVYFNILPNLPMCSTSEDFWCMSEYFGFNENFIIDQCFRSSYSAKFSGFQNHVTTTPMKIDQNKTYFGDWGISFDHISPYVEVKRERYTITTQDFIGSVGGSLGLFLGFSFFSYVNAILEKNV